MNNTDNIGADRVPPVDNYPARLSVTADNLLALQYGHTHRIETYRPLRSGKFTFEGHGYQNGLPLSRMWRDRYRAMGYVSTIFKILPDGTMVPDR